MTIDQLLENNRRWAASTLEGAPELFKKLAQQQAPEYLWIGCSDSRVPADQITGTMPGEIFVHRNLANIVAHSDFNCLSVLQFAVDVLKVRHVIVCGHYGCSGVLEALRGSTLGLVDYWLRHVRDIKHKYEPELAQLPNQAAQHNRLCELNVIEQVANVSRTPIVQDAWQRGQTLALHGLIYSLQDGVLRELVGEARSTQDVFDHIKQLEELHEYKNL